MSFSAIASFAIATALTYIGFRSIKKAHAPKQYLFACIPFLFAGQQFAEGMLWIVLPDSNCILLEHLFTSIVLLTAQVIWPVWIPLSVYLLERNVSSRKALLFLIGTGFVVSMFYMWCFVTYGTVARIGGSHICYQQSYPALPNEVARYLFVIATVVPAFLSKFRRLWITGLALFISYLITKIYYDNYLISVWADFAAAVSLTVRWVLGETRKKS